MINNESLPAHGHLPLVSLGHVFPSDGVKSSIREPLLGEGGQQTHIEDVIEHEERDDEEGKLPEQPVLASERMHEALPDRLMLPRCLFASCHTSTLVTLVVQVFLRRETPGNPDLPIIIIPRGHNHHPFWRTHWLYVWLHLTTTPI